MCASHQYPPLFLRAIICPIFLFEIEAMEELCQTSAGDTYQIQLSLKAFSCWVLRPKI